MNRDTGLVEGAGQRFGDGGSGFGTPGDVDLVAAIDEPPGKIADVDLNAAYLVQSRHQEEDFHGAPG